LLERTGAGYGLTEKGEGRLHFFEVSGCNDPACPLCEGKDGYLSCPRCGHQITKRSARILKKKDLLLVVRHAGVYCKLCLGLILNEAQARLMGIQEE
jgi:hypothetical protein